MDELKPCPFCGSEAVIIDTGDYFPGAIFYRIVCESSCTMQSRLYRTIEESVKAWNTRKTGKHDCNTCLRQACKYRDVGTIRVNCPLWKESAV